MLAKPKILIVDDERVIASTLATILDGQGYETLTANSGEEAVRVACSFQPKLLLSDISMGALNGVDAAMSILTFLPHCKVLFASGHASCADVLENARAQGFNFEVLTKPVPPPELLAKISTLLRHEGYSNEEVLIKTDSITPLIVLPHSMVIDCAVVIEKKKRKSLAKRRMPLHPLTAHAARLSPVMVVASQKRTPAFNPRDVFAKLSVGKTCKEYQADQSVFSQGDAADAVFYIESGKVRLTVVSSSGKGAVVAILPEASFFGEGCLAGQLIRLSTASTVERTTVFRVTKPAMLTLLHQEPGFAEHLLAHLLSRNIRMEADLVDHLFNSSEKRLARHLLLMANFGQESKPTPLIAKISQDTLAAMVGTTRSRVSFFLNRFRKLGFIDYGGGGIHVHSSLASVVLHD